MSDTRIEHLKNEIAEAKQRKVDFGAYPDAVKAAEDLIAAAQGELEQLAPAKAKASKPSAKKGDSTE